MQNRITFEENSLNPEQPEKTELDQLLLELQNAQKPEVVKEILGEVLNHLKNDLGINLSPNIADLYEEMEKQDILLRAENLIKIIESLEKHTPLAFGTSEDHYANAVVPSQEGLSIALAEGEAPGPIKILIGFNIKSLIGFDPTDFQIHSIESNDPNIDPRDQEKRLKNCRHVSGNLPPEQIKYLVLRAPRATFPDNHLTNEEKNASSSFIFRGAKINF